MVGQLVEKRVELLADYERIRTRMTSLSPQVSSDPSAGDEIGRLAGDQVGLAMLIGQIDAWLALPEPELDAIALAWNRRIIEQALTLTDLGRDALTVRRDRAVPRA